MQIFPEGTTHSDASLQPLRTGAARIALLSEERSDWSLGLTVMPVGLTYQRKELFRGLGLATYGKAFPVARYREEYEQDPQGAVRRLTADITSGLKEITLNFSRTEDRELVETAERLYSTEKGWSSARSEEGLAQRFPRLKAFEEGLAWLRLHDPDRHHDMTRRVARYRRKLRALGVEAGEVPVQYRALAMVRYALLDLIPFALGLPLAILGTLIWYPLYQGPRILTKPRESALRSHLELQDLLRIPHRPLVQGFWVFMGWVLGGWRLALAFGLIAPLLGVIAIGWKDRWRQLSGDIRLFRRAFRREDRRRDLAKLRADFVTEFDAVAREMAAAGTPPRAWDPAPVPRPPDSARGRFA